MKSVQTVTFAGVVLVALFAVLLLGTRLANLDLNPFDSREYTEVGTTVVHSVRDLSELSTVEVVEYTTIEKGSDAGLLNRFRGDRIFLFAVARVGAGVDLSQLDESSFEVDPERNHVRLTVPPPHILYVAMDNQATRVYDRDTGLLTKGSRDLESQARQRAEEVLRAQALESGILQTASENAERALTAFLKGLGYESVEVVVRRQPETAGAAR